MPDMQATAVLEASWHFLVSFGSWEQSVIEKCQHWKVVHKGDGQLHVALNINHCDIVPHGWHVWDASL